MYLICCGRKLKAKTYLIEPQEGFIETLFLWVENCSHCDCAIATIIRQSPDGEVSYIRKTNLKAHRLYDKIKPKILYEIDNTNPIIPTTGKNYLYYSEFGNKKKCYSNLSTLQLGKQDILEELHTAKLLKKESGIL